MRLPNVDLAFVELRKLVEYLLALNHPEGGSKARFFSSVGFLPSQPGLLRRALLEVARGGEVVEVESSEYGTKYVVDGAVLSPSGRTIYLRTVWMIGQDRGRPRLVTAYPAD